MKLIKKLKKEIKLLRDVNRYEVKLIQMAIKQLNCNIKFTTKHNLRYVNKVIDRVLPKGDDVLINDINKTLKQKIKEELE